MQSIVSLSATQQILNIIIDNVNEQIRAQDYAMKNLQKFSTVKVINIANENNAMLDFQPLSKDKILQQKEPQPLTTDNLIPIFLDIQNKVSKKQQQQKTEELLKQNTKDNKKKSKTSENPPKNQFVEVHWSGQRIYTEDDVFTKQIKKDKQQRVAKDLKKQQQQKKSQKKREQNKKFDEKVNFGYDGQLIKIRNQTRNSLINQILNSRASQDILKEKEITSPPKPQSVERTKEKKQIKKMRRDDVQFSDIKNLMQEVSVTQGVKYTHNKATLQVKKKNRTVSGIKKSLSTHRLTKDEYNKIKNIYTTEAPQSITSNSIIHKTKTQKDDSINRSVSQLGLSTTKKKGLIHVNNQQLKETLLTKINPYEVNFNEQAIIKIQDEEKKNKINLDKNDQYNINYITGKSKNKQQQNLSSVKLPKIVHKTDHNPYHPKNREKIKDGTMVMLELRKKFQEKLRI